MDNEVLLDAVSAAAAGKGITMVRDEKLPALRCAFDMNGTKLKRCRVTVTAAGGGIMCVTSPLVKADEPSRAALCELFDRVNIDLLRGGFEMNADSGDVRFRAFMQQPAEEAQLYGPASIFELLMLGPMMFDRYGDAILDVMFGRDTPAHAAAEARTRGVPGKKI